MSRPHRPGLWHRCAGCRRVLRDRRASGWRRVLPVAALTGAVFLQLVDLAARTIAEPTELPLSIVTAVFGVPFFLWLMRRRSPDRTASLA